MIILCFCEKYIMDTMCIYIQDDIARCAPLATKKLKAKYPQSEQTIRYTHKTQSKSTPQIAITKFENKFSALRDVNKTKRAARRLCKNRLTASSENVKNELSAQIAKAKI